MKVAEVNFSFKMLQSTPDLHRYDLQATVILNEPPAQQFRLRLLWPTQVRVSQMNGFVEGEHGVIEIKNGRFACKELCLYGLETIFPGQTLRIIGAGLPAVLNYEIDDEIHDILSMFNIPLRCTLYLELQMPIEMEVPFGELQQF